MLFRSSDLMRLLVFITILTLAISLEGAEIILFFQSGFNNHDTFYANLLGSLLGLGIGLSVGAMVYYFLSQASTATYKICLVLLTFISAGMAAQATAYLMQADIIDSGYPVWNSNFLVDERSVFGQLLYAFVGYEASPTLSQVIVWGIFIIVPVITYAF